MNDLDKQLADLQAGLDNQIQQVQAEIDGALGTSSAEKVSVVGKKLKKFYAEIHLERGYQLVYSPVDAKEANLLMDADDDVFEEKCDEILMGDEAYNAEFYHVVNHYDDMAKNSKLVVKDEEGHVVYEKTDILSLPWFYSHNFDNELGYIDSCDMEEHSLDLRLYGLKDGDDFDQWMEDKKEKLEASYDFESENIRKRNVRKTRFNMLGLYEETNKTITFDYFETESFDPSKLAFISPIIVDYSGSIIQENEDLFLLVVDSLAYDDHILDTEDHDFSWRSRHSFELLEKEESIKYTCV